MIKACMEGNEPPEELQNLPIDSVKEEGTTNSSIDDDAGSEYVLGDVHVTQGPYPKSQNQEVLSIQLSVNMSPMKNFFRLHYSKGWEDASFLSSIPRKKKLPVIRFSKQNPLVRLRSIGEDISPYLETVRSPQFFRQMGCTIMQATASKLHGGARIIEDLTRIYLVIEHMNNPVKVTTSVHRIHLHAPCHSLPRPPERVQRIVDALHDNQNSVTFHHLAFEPIEDPSPKWAANFFNRFEGKSFLLARINDTNPSSIRLEGGALDLFSWLSVDQLIRLWDALTHELQKQFEPAEFQNTIEFLCSIQQIELKSNVRIHKPKTTYGAMSLAIKYESKVSHTRSWKGASFILPAKVDSTPAPSNSRVTIVTTQTTMDNRLSDAEKLSRFIQGECYQRGEEYGRGHRCKTGTFKLSGDEITQVVVTTDQVDTHNVAEVSIQVILGKSKHLTLAFYGTIYSSKRMDRISLDLSIGSRVEWRDGWRDNSNFQKL
ncbi:hypothetical protein E3N88_31041 [Mikania micrantha]|uniref:Uncharacterized protein n=1 Tax=Mikania micrantha TaxID=192012 RepID=A0A5N6MQK3_9ASTR|nr:hypothetical protein E3N88_31041 [Mikania micrantha]